jgi:hypothetical protein
MPILIETFEEFAQRQGCKHFAFAGQFLFENGAVSDGRRHSDPPADPKTLLQAKRQYLKLVLDFEVKEFNAFKHKSIEMANLHERNPQLPSGVGPEAVEMLRQGKARIERLRGQLAVIDEQLVDPEAARNRQEQASWMAQDQMRHRDYVHQVMQIEI